MAYVFGEPAQSMDLDPEFFDKDEALCQTAGAAVVLTRRWDFKKQE